jgi:hypothetical protein
MKIMGTAEVATVVDIKCDVCGASTKVSTGGHQFGTLEARWGYGAAHDGERYELHLCEGCFFQAVAKQKQEMRAQKMFIADASEMPDDLGLVAKDDYFADSSPRGRN